MRGEWRVEIRDKPTTKRMPSAVLQEFEALLEELRETGHISGAKALSGYDEVFSARMNRGRWRILYARHARSMFIQVLRAEPRGDAYSGMKSGG